MKKIKNNKGVIIFYILIIVSAFILKIDNDKYNQENINESVVYHDISK